MTGMLITSRPWYSERSGTGGKLLLGELLTFAVGKDAPLTLQYPFPRNSPRLEFSADKAYSIEDLGATFAGLDPGVCYEAQGIRIFRLREIR